MRRPLGDTLAELAEALSAAPEISPWVRVTTLRLDVPLDVELRHEREGWQLAGDLPRWRWRTHFDAPTNRLRLTWQEAS